MANIPNLGYLDGINLDTSLFTAEEIDNAELVVQQFMADYAPSLNLTKGTTLYDLLIRPRALHAAMRKELDDAREATQSLQGVIDNPALADDATVDAILSNKGIKRRFGSLASGTVKIVVSRDTAYVISADMQFTANNKVFNPTGNYRALTSPVAIEDLQLYATDATNTQFYFLVPVVAVENGVASQITDLTGFTITPSVPNLIVASAFGNFVGGAEDETNEEFIAREPEAMAAKNMVSRVAIAGALKDQFSFVRDVSVQGMNDLAMSRNSANLLSFKLGGYADIYLRTTQSVLTTVLNKTAVRQQINPDQSATYSIQIDTDDVPGFYFVSAINQAGTTNAVSSFIISSEIKDIDPQDDVQTHLLPTLQDGVYSSYQKATAIFEMEYDETKGTPEDQFLATLSMDVSIAYQPGIREVQDFVSDPNRGVVLADYLVKAGIPCFVSMTSIRVTAIEGTSGEEIRKKVYEYINSIPFGGTVRVDEIVSIIKAFSGVQSVDLPIRLTGDIFAPDGTTRTIRSQSILEIPSVPEILVTPYTTLFFAELSDIPIAMVDA